MRHLDSPAHQTLPRASLNCIHMPHEYPRIADFLEQLKDCSTLETQALEKDKEDCVLYVMADGSAVNTRVQDENGSTWNEMKLGMVFTDKDIRQQNKHIYILRQTR